MKIRFLYDTYIRVSPKVTGNEPVGSIFKGTEIEVEDIVVQGDMIQQNDSWYRDKNGWYYWSGRAVPVEEEQSVGPVHEGYFIAPAHSQTSEQGHVSSDDIPTGETRCVPSLDELLELDKNQRAGLLDTPTVPSLLESAPTERDKASTKTAGTGANTWSTATVF